MEIAMHMTPLEIAVIESCYQRVVTDFQRLGKRSGRVLLAYSHRAGGMVTIRSNDYRFDKVEGDPNYEIIGTYSGIPLPARESIAGDILAHFDEKAPGGDGDRATLSGHG